MIDANTHYSRFKCICFHVSCTLSLRSSLSKWDGLSVNHYLTGALAFFEREVRILNNAKRIAERVDDRANENPVPDILHLLMLSCSLFYHWYFLSLLYREKLFSSRTV